MLKKLQMLQHAVTELKDEQSELIRGGQAPSIETGILNLFSTHRLITESYSGAFRRGLSPEIPLKKESDLL